MTTDQSLLPTPDLEAQLDILGAAISDEIEQIAATQPWALAMAALYEQGGMPQSLRCDCDRKPRGYLRIFNDGYVSHRYCYCAQAEERGS